MSFRVIIAARIPRYGVMRMRANHLANMIEPMRTRLHDALVGSGYRVTPEIILLSTKLDELLNEYNRQVLGHDKRRANGA